MLTGGPLYHPCVQQSYIQIIEISRDYFSLNSLQIYSRLFSRGTTFFIPVPPSSYSSLSSGGEGNFKHNTESMLGCEKASILTRGRFVCLVLLHSEELRPWAMRFVSIATMETEVGALGQEQWKRKKGEKA